MSETEIRFPPATIVIPTHTGAATIEAAVRSVLDSDYPDFEILVVDNGSTLETQQALKHLPSEATIIVAQRNLGFAGGNNLGLARAQGEIVVLLNDDTEVRPDWLRNLVEPLVSDPRVGMTGSLILEADGKQIQHSGAEPGTNFLNVHLDKGTPLDQAPKQAIERSYVMGAAVAFHKELLAALGGVPEVYFPGYYEDIELCYRIRRLDLKILVVPTAILIHKEKQTTSSEREYLRAYHRNRWQFILRNLSGAGVLKAGGGELAWLLKITYWRDFRHHRPLLHAYAFNLLRLPRILKARRKLKRENDRLRRKGYASVFINRREH